LVEQRRVDLHAPAGAERVVRSQHEVVVELEAKQLQVAEVFVSLVRAARGARTGDRRERDQTSQRSTRRSHGDECRPRSPRRIERPLQRARRARSRRSDRHSRYDRPLTPSTGDTTMNATAPLPMASVPTRLLAGIAVADTPLDFGERFVPGYKARSTVDYLWNAPFDE
jgi:hypothetical protein